MSWKVYDSDSEVSPSDQYRSFETASKDDWTEYTFGGSAERSQDMAWDGDWSFKGLGGYQSSALTTYSNMSGTTAIIWCYGYLPAATGGGGVYIELELADTLGAGAGAPNGTGCWIRLNEIAGDGYSTIQVMVTVADSPYDFVIDETVQLPSYFGAANWKGLKLHLGDGTIAVYVDPYGYKSWSLIYSNNWSGIIDTLEYATFSVGHEDTSPRCYLDFCNIDMEAQGFNAPDYNVIDLEVTRELDGIGSGYIIIEEKDIDYSVYDSLQEHEIKIVDPYGNVKLWSMVENPVLMGNDTVKLELKEVTQQLTSRTCKRDNALEKGVLTDVEDDEGTYYLYDESKSWAEDAWNTKGVLTFPSPVPKYPIAFATCSNTKPISLVSTGFGVGRGLAKTASEGTFDEGMDDLTGTYDTPVVQADIMTNPGIWLFGIKPGSVDSQLEVLRTDASTSLPLECVRITCESRLSIGVDGFPIMDMYVDMSGIPTDDIVGIIFHVQGAVRDGTRQSNGISVFIMDYNVGTDDGRGAWEELTGASTRITTVAIPDGYGGDDPGIWGLYEETFELATGSEGFSKLAQSAWADYVFTWKEWKVWPDYTQSYVADHKVLRLCIVGRDHVDYDSSNYCGIHIGSAYVTIIRSGTDTNQYTVADTLAPSKIEVTPDPTPTVGAGDKYVICPSTKQVFDDFDNATYGANDYLFEFSDTLSITDFIPTNFLGDTHYNTLKFISDYSKARWWLDIDKALRWGDETDISDSGVTLDSSNLNPKHTTLSFPQSFIIKKCIVRGNPTLGLVYTATSESSDATREEVINLPHATYYKELQVIGDAVIDRYGAKKPFIETVMDYAAPEVPDMEIGTYITCDYSTLSSEEMKVQRYTISWKAGDKARIVFNLGDPKSPDPFKKRDVLNKILERVYRLEVNPSGIDWTDRTSSLIMRAGVGSGEVGDYLSSDGSTPLSGDWDAGAFEIRTLTFESDVTTGTAPFTIASTTVSTNLNADLWDGYQFADYIDQAIKQASSPTFVGLTLSADLVTSSTIDGVDIATLKTNHDSLQTDVDGFPDELKNLAATEIAELEAIGATTISVTQWAYLGELDQTVKIDSNVKFQQITINNQGAGTDPVFTCNSHLDLLDLTGDLRMSEDYIFKSGTAFDGLLSHNISANKTWTFPDVTGTVITSANPTDLDHDTLNNFVAAKHVSLPNTIVNVLSDHTTAVHDALNITKLGTQTEDIYMGGYDIVNPLEVRYIGTSRGTFYSYRTDASNVNIGPYIQMGKGNADSWYITAIHDAAGAVTDIIINSTSTGGASAAGFGDIVFKPDAVEKMRIQADGISKFSGNINLQGYTIISNDEDDYELFGRAYVGYAGHADHAGFGHRDHRAADSYALLQNSVGSTFLNASITKSLWFRINNVTIMDMSASGLVLGAGARCNYIRDEDNMASDSAVSLCTQQSIKKYVDDEVAGGGGVKTDIDSLDDVTIASSDESDFLVCDAYAEWNDMSAANVGTLLEGHVSHDNINDTHNLTTDVDHDNILNFAAGEHFTMLDEDDMATDSATQAATQQSIKKYVDDNAGVSLTEEQVEDYVGGMLTGNTETLITVTYQDVDGTIDFVVAEANINHDALTNFVANEHLLTAAIDHDALLNFAANEHYLQTAITVLGAVATCTSFITQGNVTCDHIIPNDANTYNIGEALNKFNDIYCIGLNLGQGTEVQDIDTEMQAVPTDSQLLTAEGIQEWVGGLGGSGNAEWIPFSMLFVSPSDAVCNNSGVTLRNAGGTDGKFVFNCPLPTNKGGKKLYISNIKVGLMDADAGDYITNCFLFGHHTNSYDTIWNDATNRTTPAICFTGDGTWAAYGAATDLSGYDYVMISVYFNFTNALDVDFSFCSAEMYYA